MKRFVFKYIKGFIALSLCVITALFAAGCSGEEAASKDLGASGTQTVSDILNAAGEDAANAGEATQKFAFTNGTYNGNIYNASGSDGLDGNALNVTFGKGAVYSGAAAYTSAIHVSYDGSAALKAGSFNAFENADDAAAFAEKYQLTSYPIDEYFNMGHVANMICDNGGNAVNITLEDDAVWNLTAASAISSLTISGDAQVVIPADVTLTVNGTDYTGTTLKAGDL